MQPAMLLHGDRVLIKMLLRMSCCSALSALLFSASPSNAQNFSGSGQSWTSTWGFGSAADRSLSLQQAQVIKNAEQGADPTSISTSYVTNSTIYDNRSNYIEANSAGGAISSDQHVVGNDEIGQQTYAVGSLNTGSTVIDVIGANNEITATNAAESRGCIDGSVSSSALEVPESGSILTGLLADTSDSIENIISGNGLNSRNCEL